MCMCVCITPKYPYLSDEGKGREERMALGVLFFLFSFFWERFLGARFRGFGLVFFFFFIMMSCNDFDGLLLRLGAVYTYLKT